MRWVFFWHRGSRGIWVWVMTRMIWQYFFMLLNSFSSCCLPSSSCHLQYLVEGFLRLTPILIEVSFALILDVFSKDGLKSTETLSGFFIAHDAHNHHGWCLHNGHILHNFLLFHLGSGSVDLSHNVSHASLVVEQSCEVDRLGRIILGEALHLPWCQPLCLWGKKPRDLCLGIENFL